MLHLVGNGWEVFILITSMYYCSHIWEILSRMKEPTASVDKEASITNLEYGCNLWRPTTLNSDILCDCFCLSHLSANHESWGGWGRTTILPASGRSSSGSLSLVMIKTFFQGTSQKLLVHTIFFEPTCQFSWIHYFWHVMDGREGERVVFWFTNSTHTNTHPATQLPGHDSYPRQAGVSGLFKHPATSLKAWTSNKVWHHHPPAKLSCPDSCTFSSCRSLPSDVSSKHRTQDCQELVQGWLAQKGSPRFRFTLAMSSVDGTRGQMGLFYLYLVPPCPGDSNTSAGLLLS